MPRLVSALFGYPGCSGPRRGPPRLPVQPKPGGLRLGVCWLSSPCEGSAFPAPFEEYSVSFPSLPFLPLVSVAVRLCSQRFPPLDAPSPSDLCGCTPLFLGDRSGVGFILAPPGCDLWMHLVLSVTSGSFEVLGWKTVARWFVPKSGVAPSLLGLVFFSYWQTWN